MKSRVLVAAAGIPVLVWAVLWAPMPVMALALCLLAGIAGLELHACVCGGRQDVLSAALPALTVLVTYADRDAAVVWFAAMTIGVFAYGIRKAGAVRFDELASYLFAGVFIGWSFASFLRMAGYGVGRTFLLLPFILSFACDTAAFFVGRSLGKRKLAPAVSPHKTVEGAAGGLAGSLLGGLLFTFLTHRAGGGLPWAAAVLLSLLCGAAAQIGDLSFSLIKREFGVKDYGRLFLEHGGVLDRFDSVLFVTPVVEILTCLVFPIL